MSKLYYKYGAINSGKTALLLQALYNYEEQGMKVKLIKPYLSDGSSVIKTKIGLERKADLLVKNNENIRNYLEKCYNDGVACILVDEAQFLSKEHVDELYLCTKKYNIPVICYGLRTDFKTQGFPGSIRLFELADEMEEIYTVCSCGARARINARKKDGEYITVGNQIEFDKEAGITYEGLCGKCYLEKVLHIKMIEEEKK